MQSSSLCYSATRASSTEARRARPGPTHLLGLGRLALCGRRLKFSMPRAAALSLWSCIAHPVSDVGPKDQAGDLRRAYFLHARRLLKQAQSEHRIPVEEERSRIALRIAGFRWYRSPSRCCYAMVPARGAHQLLAAPEQRQPAAATRRVRSSSRRGCACHLPGGTRGSLRHQVIERSSPPHLGVCTVRQLVVAGPYARMRHRAQNCATQFVCRLRTFLRVELKLRRDGKHLEDPCLKAAPSRPAPNELRQATRHGQGVVHSSPTAAHGGCALGAT